MNSEMQNKFPFMDPELDGSKEAGGEMLSDLHEPLNLKTVQAAIDRLKNNDNHKELGKLVALDQSVIQSEIHAPSGYVFCYWDHPSASVLEIFGTNTLTPTALEPDEQRFCQSLLVPDQSVQELEDVDVVSESSVGSSFANTSEAKQVDEDDDVLFTRADGTKVYRQDRYDKTRGTY